MPSGNHKFSEGVFVSLFLFRLAPPADRRMFSAPVSRLGPVQLPFQVLFLRDLAIGQLLLSELPLLQEAVKEMIAEAECHM